MEEVVTVVGDGEVETQGILSEWEKSWARSRISCCSSLEASQRQHGHQSCSAPLLPFFSWRGFRGGFSWDLMGFREGY